MGMRAEPIPSAGSGTPARSSRGDVARAALLDAAERLFAQRGIEAVSLRDVCAAAGQRNHSAAQYHFGDRRGVVAAVFERRMGEVHRRRQRMLERWTTIPDRDDVPDLVAALVVPLVDVVAETGGWYGRFLARVQWDPFATDIVDELAVGTSYRQTLDLIAGAVDLPRTLRRVRFDQLGSLLIGTIAGWEWQGERGTRRLRATDLQHELIATMSAVAGAPTRRSTP